MKRIMITIALITLSAGMARAQTLGPGDTLFIPCWAKDSVSNGTPIDSAHDSAYVTVWQSSHVGTSDSMLCYAAKFLLDASTSSTVLRTSGRAQTTGITFQRFTFFAPAYTVTNSSTTTGTYNYNLLVRDSSLKLWTEFNGSFDYVYENTSAGTFAATYDSMYQAGRFIIKSLRSDTTAAGYLKTDIYSFGATAVTGRDIGASVLLSSGTGTGQLAFSSGIVQSNLIQVLSNTTDTTGGNGRLAVNARYIGNALPGSATIGTATSVTNTVNANLVSILGTAADTTGGNGRLSTSLHWIDGVALGTHTAGYAPVDLRYIGGSALSTSTAQIGVNLVNIAGSAVSTSTAQLGVNAVQIGASVPGSATIGTVTNLTNAPTAGDFTSTMKSSITTAVPTAAQNGAATWTTSSVSPSAGTYGNQLQRDSINIVAIKTKTDYLPSITAGSAGGVFIAGSNAATTVNFTGSLSGAVGSISGITFPTNFNILSISATTGLVDITQTAADKMWAAAIGTKTVTVNAIAANAITASAMDTTAALELAQNFWRADTGSLNNVAGSYGKALSEAAYVQGAAAGTDSAFFSRFQRRIFGLGGVGTDTLTQAQRTVTALMSADSMQMYRMAGWALHDSAVSVDTATKKFWEYDSTAAHLFATTSMGRQLAEFSGGSYSLSNADISKLLDSMLLTNMTAYRGQSNYPSLGYLFAQGLDSLNDLDEFDLWAALKDSALAHREIFGDLFTISGDTGAANNLEATLDGTGGVNWRMGQLKLDGSNANGNFIITNSGGPAVVWTTTSALSDVFVLDASNTSTGGAIAYKAGPYGTAAKYYGGSILGSAVSYASAGGPAIDIYSSGSYGERVRSGATDAYRAIGGGTGGSGASYAGSGSGSGISAVAGATGIAGISAFGGPYGFFGQGTTYGILGYSQTGPAGLAGWSDGTGSHGILGIGGTGMSGIGGVMDSVAGVGGGGSLDIGTLAQAILDSSAQHPEIYLGSATYDQIAIVNLMLDSAAVHPEIFGSTAAGTGTHAWSIYVRDTVSGIFHSNAKVTLYTPGDEFKGALITNNQGKAGTFMQDPGPYTVFIEKQGIYSSAVNLNLATNGQVDTIKAWKALIPFNLPPDQAVLIMTYYPSPGLPKNTAYFQAVCNEALTDTARGNVVGPWKVVAKTDGWGNAWVNVPKAYQFKESNKAKYTLELWQNNVRIWSRSDFVVPNQDTVRVTNRSPQ